MPSHNYSGVKSATFTSKMKWSRNTQKKLNYLSQCTYIPSLQVKISAYDDMACC